MQRKKSKPVIFKALPIEPPTFHRWESPSTSQSGSPSPRQLVANLMDWSGGSYSLGPVLGKDL